jgi:hypothetical protein
VVFHDVSFVEATPRYDKKNKLAVKIELTDFSVYYTQGAAEAAIAAMKEGKSDVLCEASSYLAYYYPRFHALKKKNSRIVTSMSHAEPLRCRRVQ